MSNTSRKFVLAEAMLLLAPATVLAALGVAWSGRFLVQAMHKGDWYDPTTWMALAIAAGLIGSLSGWWLLVRYLRGSAIALGRGAGPAWAGAAVGLAGALGGVWLTALGNGWIFAIGLAAVVPLLHLWWLRGSVSG